MPMKDAIVALRHFLNDSGLDPKGVRLTVEFDDYGKALHAWDKFKQEFSALRQWEIPKQMPVVSMTVLEIPVKFTTRVE